MRRYTREELASNNGKNGALALIAFRGKIYDVSPSFHWRGGKHQVMHRAGEDLTDAIARAPHSAELLERFSAVGVLED